LLCLISIDKLAEFLTISRFLDRIWSLSAKTLHLMEYFVYILQSLTDGSFYIGYTSSVELRLKTHNAGESKYTSKKIPWKVVYIETYSTKNQAIVRERFLKKQRNRDFYRSLIDDYKT